VPVRSQPTGTTGAPPTPAGVISGFVLRLIREGIGLTQDGLAEQARVDPNTVKGWETGRRPLANMKVQTLRTLRRRLHHLGANPWLLTQLETAIDADLFIGQVLDASSHDDPGDHALATWVSTRGWNELLAWTLTGKPPPELRTVSPRMRRGPVPTRPTLATDEQGAFFANLRGIAERTLDCNGQSYGFLLRRQVYFLAALDRSTTGREWLADMERQELRHLRPAHGWTPAWVAERSLAVARSRHGDREHLRRFINRRLLVSDQCEAANLNYWAYWIGEQATPAASDDFMARDLGNWRGTELLRHLTAGLDVDTPYVELSIHTVWSLLHRRPHILAEDQPLAERLSERVDVLLDADSDADLGPQARRELDQIHFATGMMRGTR
jgi:transcriptional regulator with XRE-family HTH domain